MFSVAPVAPRLWWHDIYTYILILTYTFLYTLHLDIYFQQSKLIDTDSVISFRALLPHMYGDSNKLFQCFVELVFFYFLFAHNIHSKL